MKVVPSYLLAFCACVWYLLSASGIDIHTDAHDDRAYIVPLFSGISCERIHPEDECHCCHIHMHRSSCACELETEDCTDSISVLDIPGFSVPQLQCPEVPFSDIQPASTVFPAAVPSSFGRCLRLFCGPPPDIIAEICILRV